MKQRSLRERRLGGRVVVGWGILVAMAMAGTGLAINQFSHEQTKLGATNQETVAPELEVKQPPVQASIAAVSPAPARAQERATSARTGAIVGGQGFLRISNQTGQVIRVALLIKKPGKSSSATEVQPLYEPPAHWDFDPGEGGEKGLIVSLPKRNLKLKPGDILVAFAQDGSRHYWGPFVVGATSDPIWQPKTREWELVLAPQP